MDNRLHRPQIFVRVEFGVSWSPQHAPRTRGFQYRSGRPRERSPNFPRHVAAPNTNYLTATSFQQFQQQQVQQYMHSQQQLQQQHRQPRRHADQSQTSRQIRSQQPQPERRESRTRQVEDLQEEVIFEESRRSSRSSKSSHERGRSAPPPLSDNNWDLVQSKTSPRTMVGSSTAAATAVRPASNVWKELPEVPSRFRLGEDGMPWESLTFPMGWEPYIERDDLNQEPSEHSVHRQDDHLQGLEWPSVPDHPIHSPPNVTFNIPYEEYPYRQHDLERVRELEALGSAMMTIDNGFENQWWNQGERQTMPTPSPAAGDLIKPVHPPPVSHDDLEEQLALGWASSLPPGAVDDRLSFSTANNIISPVLSGPTGTFPRLSRSLSTRSDELWFNGRYA